MNNYCKVFIPILILLSVLLGCNEHNKESLSFSNEFSYKSIADTIITDVVIKNPDHNEWTDYALRNLNREKLIDNLFDLVYSEELIPYNFFSDSAMSINEIKQIEKEENYIREKIGKVQFEEAWYFDSANQRMIKKVHSIMIAYELYDPNGNIKGYKPIFKVYFNN